MLPIPHVLRAEGDRQTRYHLWLARVYTGGAVLLPFAGASLASVGSRQPTGTPKVLSWLLLGMCASLSCVLGRYAGVHGAAAAAFARVANGPHTAAQYAVHDLNRAYAMTESNDGRNSSVTLTGAHSTRDGSMEEVQL